MTAGCPTGKRLLTKRAAHAQAKAFRLRWAARMHAYRCKRCGAWHVGNTIRKPGVRR